MESTRKLRHLILFLVIVGVLWGFKYKELKEQNVYLEESLSEYQDALEEANNNIEEANSIIEDAQWYAWSSYEDMGYALDNLYTVDTISEPWGNRIGIRLPSLSLPSLPKLPSLLPNRF